MKDAGAKISEDGLYRYRLWRAWGEGLRVCWVMLNPSTADANTDDATIRRCMGFARRWGFDGIDVVNLFGLRSTKPEGLANVVDAVGPENDESLLQAAASCPLVVAAWGHHGWRHGRGDIVSSLLLRQGLRPMCLGVTKSSGQPRHPLYIRTNTELEPLHR